MRSPLLSVLAVFGVGLLSAPAVLQEKGGDDRTGPYDVVDKWPKPFADKPGYIWGSTGGIFAESPNRVFIANRGMMKLPDKLPANFTGVVGLARSAGHDAHPEFRNCIVVVDAQGNMVETWTQWDKLLGRSRGPHHIKINPYDPEKHVWIIDDDPQQIFKFTNDGKKLVMTLGERDWPGNDEQPFRPADRHRLAARRHLLHDRRIQNSASSSSTRTASS